MSTASTNHSAIDNPRIVIIGAGISGALMGIKLLERGLSNFIILEKAERMGGTWRDNTYPGVACDVAAHLYVYSFAPNPNWRRRYAPGEQLWQYYHNVTKRYGVLPYIQYGKEVVSANFVDDCWQLRTDDGAEYEADLVVSAVGRLHHPAYPDIPGMNTFAGRAFHTSRWDNTIDLKGKRLGLIGTGSTATQIVTATANTVAELKLFQRTAQWVYPVVNTAVPWWKRALFKVSSQHAKRYYKQLQAETEARGVATAGDDKARQARDEMCIQALATVKDPVLRAKLTPDYAPGCKRMVFSEHFYRAVQSPSVDLITDNIDHIAKTGVVTNDGKLHELDLLVYATGFDSQAFMRPMEITGENGVKLEDVWHDNTLSYRSMCIPQMPNMILINGPYSPGGTASVVGIVEVQVNYALQLIDRIVKNNIVLHPRKEAAENWLKQVRAKASNTVWATGGCNSWYLDSTGTPTIDPTTLSELTEQLATPTFADFIERPRRKKLSQVA